MPELFITLFNYNIIQALIYLLSMIMLTMWRKWELNLRKSGLQKIIRMRNAVPLVRNLCTFAKHEDGDANRLVAFAKMCVNIILDPVFTIESDKVVPSETTAKLFPLHTLTSSETLTACLLPSNCTNMMYSSMSAYKTGGDLSYISNIMVKRQKGIDQVRFEETIHKLKQNQHVVWHGHSDIGVDMEANFLLMEFLKHLGEEGWPTLVAARVGKQLFEYKKSPHEEELQCSTHTVETLYEIHQYTLDQETKAKLDITQKPILFLQLEAGESNPLVNIPTFLAIPTYRYLGRIFKSFERMTASNEYIVRPLTTAEMRLWTKLIFQISPTKMKKKHSLSTTATERQLMKSIDQRLATVGPRTSLVFCSEDEHKFYLIEMLEAAEIFSIRSVSLFKTSLSNFPLALENYLAPTPCLTDKDNDKSMLFLSDLSALITRVAIATNFPPLLIGRILNKPLQSQMARIVIKYALSYKAKDQGLLKACTEWTWYTNSTRGQCYLDTSEIPLHNQCRALHQVEDVNVGMDAQSLKKETYYQLHSDQKLFGKAVVVGFTANKQKKKVTSINIFIMVEPYHCSQTITPINCLPMSSISDLESLFQWFNLSRKVNQQVRLNLIYVIDKVIKHNLMYDADKHFVSTEDGRQGKSLNVAELKERFPDIGNRIDTFIAVTSFYKHRETLEEILFPEKDDNQAVV